MLRFIREIAPAPRNEDEQTAAALFGKAPDLEIAIHQGCQLDAALTEKSARPRYVNTLMIAKRNAGEKDYVSEPLTDEHRAMFPRAWAWWQAQEKRRAAASVELLPGITPADIAELRELKITDLDQLADCSDIPVELADWQAMARRFRTLSKPRMRLVDGAMVAA